MNAQTTPALTPSSVALRLGMCAAALAGTAAPVQDANAVVISFNTPIVIPQTLAGIYINFLTGATGGSGAAVSGWDFNPYHANAGTQLGFYWDVQAGGVAATATGPYLSLAPSSVVSAASTFTRTILGTTGSPYLNSGTHVLGFRFLNEDTASINYGYLTMTNGANAGFPATITGWSFENSGAAITTPIPEPGTGAMLTLGALALGALNLRRLRRERRQQAH